MPLASSMDSIFDLETTCCFSSPDILAVPAAFSRIKTRTQKNDNDMLNNLHFVGELAYRSQKALEEGNVSVIRGAVA